MRDSGYEANNGCGRRDFNPRLEVCVRSQFGVNYALIQPTAIGIHLPEPLGGLTRVSLWIADLAWKF